MSVEVDDKLDYVPTTDPGQNHILDENSDKGHCLIKGLAAWADSQVNYDRLRDMFRRDPDLTKHLNQV